MLVGDHFFEFTWGTSCKNKLSDNLVQFLVNLVVGAGFDSSEIILSDNGGEVTNKLVDDINFGKFKFN